MSTPAQPVPLLPPLPVPVTPDWMKDYGTGAIGDPSQRPRPDLEGLATELGRQEQKLAKLMEGDGPLSLREQINRVIDQVENIKFVLDNLFPPEPYSFQAGAYQLAAVCEKDELGDPIPPREAPWAGGEGEFLELRQKIDALAQLMQHHKNLRQPVCMGRGNGPGNNVTVHFESD